MQVLVVYCHPRPDSYCRALCESAIAGLDRAGHDVVLLDLYREGFRAQMNPEERRAYETDSPILDPMVARHAAAVAQAEAIVFVYPTWWWGLPALLKGWLDRVLVPGVAFTLVDGKVVPGLRRIRRIAGITSYGSSRTYVRIFTDGGRRTIARTLRILCHRRARTQWLGLYAVDQSSDQQRRAFLVEVEEAMAGW